MDEKPPPSIEEIKKSIQDRYTRLREGNRRPSIEYMTTEDILEIFWPYIPIDHKEKFLKFSEQELQEFCTQWYNEYRKKLTTDTELDPLDIE